MLIWYVYLLSIEDFVMFDMFAACFWCRLEDEFGLCIVDGDDPSCGCSLLGSIEKETSICTITNIAVMYVLEPER